MNHHNHEPEFKPLGFLAAAIIAKAKAMRSLRAEANLFRELTDETDRRVAQLILRSDPTAYAKAKDAE